MKCRLCAWLCNRCCPPETRVNTYWTQVSRWEEVYASQWEPWDDDENRRIRASAAAKLIAAEPEKALATLQELAEVGSAFAMRWVATLHKGAHGIARDDAAAEEHFRQALCAGSWMATIGYANMLFKRGAHDKWPSTLSDGMEKGFVPAHFWFGWNRHRLEPTLKAAREVRPLLDDAAKAGHPGAKLILARWTAVGKFGLRHIPRGFRMIREVIADAREPRNAAREQSCDSSLRC